MKIKNNGAHHGSKQAVSRQCGSKKSVPKLSDAGHAIIEGGGRKRDMAREKEGTPACQKCGMYNHKTKYCHKMLQQKKGKNFGGNWKATKPQETRERIERDELQVAQDVIDGLNQQIQDIFADRSSTQETRLPKLATLIEAVAKAEESIRKVPDSWEDLDRPPSGEANDYLWTLEAAKVPLPEDEPTPISTLDYLWTLEAARIPLPEEEADPELVEFGPIEDPNPSENTEVYVEGEKYKDQMMNLNIKHQVEPAQQSFYVAGGMITAVCLSLLKSVKLTARVLGGAATFSAVTDVVPLTKDICVSGAYEMASPFGAPMRAALSYGLAMASRLSWTVPLGMLTGAACWYARKYVWPKEISYTFSSFHAQTKKDSRPDALDSGKLKHADPKLIWVNVTGPRSDIPLLSIEEKMLVSMEMFNQLVIPSNFDMATDSKLAAERLRYAAKTMHSVNIDRKLVLETGQHVFQNTTQLAYAAHRQLQDNKVRHHFPDTQQESAGVWLHMATALAKLNSLSLEMSQIMPVLAGSAILIYLGACQSRSILAVVSKALPSLTSIQSTLTQL